MRHHLPEGPDGTSHEVTLHELDNYGNSIAVKAEAGQLQRPGDHRSRKLKVVCKPCNEQWMSNIQSRVKPMLIPFIAGHWSPPTTLQQEWLSAWAAMFTMVWELADPRTVAIPQSHRTHMMQFATHRSLPPGWFVWIGQIGKPRDVPVWHRAFKLFKPAGPMGAVEVTKDFDTAQTTLFAAGAIFFQTVYLPPVGDIEVTRANLTAYAAASGLRRIWPIRKVMLPSDRRSLRTIETRDMDRLMELTTAALV